MDKQELPINNPAERLYVILTRAAESSPDNFIIDVLCRAMELETSEENFIKGFGELIGLLKNIEEQVKQYFPLRKQNGYIHLIKEIRINIVRAFQQSYSTDYNNTKWKSIPYLNDRNWPILELFNGFVHDFEKDGVKYGISFEKENLNKLINDIEAWIKEIDESHLDEDIKLFFIHKLMEIRHLLKKYYRHGSSRIKTEIYATMMEIGIYKENLTEDKKEESRSFFNDCLEKLSKWAGIVNAPMNTVVIADKLLPIISQTAELVGNTVKHLLPPGI